MAGEITEASYIDIGGRIYFTGPIAGVADAGEVDGEPCAWIWVDRGKRETQRRQARYSLPNEDGEIRVGVTAVTMGKRGPVIIEFPWLPFDLYALFKSSSNVNERGTAHLVHQTGTEDLRIEWLRGLEWQDEAFEYAGDAIKDFRIHLISHGNVDP